MISIHALREESDRELRAKHMTQRISIHALREESDMLLINSAEYALAISIHALREESDHERRDQHVDYRLFQSTLSVRRATAAG